MNDVSTFDRHTCNFARKNESSDLPSKINSSTSLMAASNATAIRNVADLSANAVDNFKTSYLQLKKQNIAC